MRAILTYHSIDDSGSPISVSPEAFAHHVAWLASGRIRVLPLDILVASPPDAGDAVALTFDDGFASFGTFAWPRLSAHGLPATVFVVSAHVGGANDWGGRVVPGIPHLPLMTWDDLGRCADEGAAIGGHTRTHPSLPSIAPTRAEDEIVGGRDDIRARLGVVPAAFAYPYGDLSTGIVAAARAAFAVSCTTEYRSLGLAEDLARIPRIDAYYFQRPGALDGWGTPAFRARLAGRRTLRGARAAARRLVASR